MKILLRLTPFLLCLSLLPGSCRPPAAGRQELTPQPAALAMPGPTTASTPLPLVPARTAHVSPKPATATPTVGATSTATPDVQAQPTGAPASDYLRLRRSHATALTSHGPSPYPWHNAPALPPGVSEVWYPSGNLRLRAWLALPRDAPAKVPAVLYFHGYFGLGSDEFAHCQPFIDAGYAVLWPALRGENGNPGDFELWYGEIDDAAAAVRWLAGRPDIDAGHIYAFGYSVGGGVSTLLSLWDDLPVRLIGSCGGLYTNDAFDAWADIVPFDLNSQEERQLRLLRGNMASMQHRHIAYIGEDEGLTRTAPAAEAEARACGAPLSIQLVPGDHTTALPRAIAAFIELMNADR